MFFTVDDVVNCFRIIASKPFLTLFLQIQVFNFIDPMEYA